MDFNSNKKFEKIFGKESVDRPSKDNSFSNTILNSACGAFDKISTFKSANLNQAIQIFKNNGWWVIGLDHNSKLKINDFFINYSSIKKILLVLGSEGKGIRRLVKEN